MKHTLLVSILYANNEMEKSVLHGCMCCLCGVLLADGFWFVKPQQLMQSTDHGITH